MRKFTLLLLIPFLLFSETLDDQEKRVTLEERELELQERKAKLKEQELLLQERELALQEQKSKLNGLEKDLKALKKRDKRKKQRFFTNWRDAKIDKRYYFSIGTGYKLSDMEYENTECWSSYCEEDMVESRVNGSSTRLNFGTVTDSNNRLEFYYSYNYLGFNEVLDGDGGYTSGFGFSHKLLSNIEPISPYFKYGFEWLTTNLSDSSRVKEGLMDGFGVNIGFGVLYNFSKNIDIDFSLEKGFNSYYIDVVNECNYFDEYYGDCYEDKEAADVYDSYILAFVSLNYKF